MDRCPFFCRTCRRTCQAAAALSHRFDCCGAIEAHDKVRVGKATAWTRVTNPMRAGYLTGPSTTTPPSKENA